MQWLKRLFGGKTRDAGPPTSAVIQREPGYVFVLRLGGVLNKATTDRIQAYAAQEIARGVKQLKLLLILGDFRGWRRGDDWGDIDFFARYEANITRIAAVGDERWKDETLAFLAAGHRSGEVRYFPKEQETQARAWLTQP